MQMFADWLRAIAGAPSTLGELIEQEPSVRTLVDRLRAEVDLQLDFELLRRYERQRVVLDREGSRLVGGVRYSERGLAFKEIYEDEALQDAWVALLRHVRKRILIDEYKMEPERMIRYTEKYGPHRLALALGPLALLGRPRRRARALAQVRGKRPRLRLPQHRPDGPPVHPGSLSIQRPLLRFLHLGHPAAERRGHRRRPAQHPLRPRLSGCRDRRCRRAQQRGADREPEGARLHAHGPGLRELHEGLHPPVLPGRLPREGRAAQGTSSPSGPAPTPTTRRASIASRCRWRTSSART